MIAGLERLAARAHENGLKIYGATLTPVENAIFPGYFTPERDQAQGREQRIQITNAFALFC